MVDHFLEIIQLFNPTILSTIEIQSCIVHNTHIFFIVLFNYKALDNTNKKITIYDVVWTRLTRVGCFNWLAHYKRMRIADKTMYIVNFKHKNEVREYKRNTDKQTDRQIYICM